MDISMFRLKIYHRQPRKQCQNAIQPWIFYRVLQNDLQILIQGVESFHLTYHPYGMVMNLFRLKTQYSCKKI